MGEGGRRLLGEADPAAAPGQSLRAQLRGLRACAGAGIAASTKPGAGQRAALPAARSYPPPAGRRSRSPCQAEAGEAAFRTPPGSPAPARPRGGRRGRRFCCRPQLRGPSAARGEVLCASPIPPGQVPSARPRPPRLRHRAWDSQPRWARTLQPAPKVRRPRQHLSPGPAPPGWRPRPGDPHTAPPPQRPPERWGRGAASSPIPRAPGPVPGPELGRVPAPNALQEPGENGWARPGPEPRGTHPLPDPFGRAAAGPGGGEEGPSSGCLRSRPSPAPRRPPAHLPAVFAVAVPTAAPSSSPPRARAGAGASEGLGTGSGGGWSGVCRGTRAPRPERRSRGRPG